ncbi:hypothetical protein GCT13_25465 [Paraburkholderia sp. CNPSo 3157]|uniref:Uncharacterized protein n=1 Tax=Paraburkholderia franconis TaxID=2654983 RepID=A0A7X1TI74_9BURK|nr:hypothetical protein [Paraburkholderia franconis]MPW20145.1 hypothetical protein [Paraburkholderia franconis]
MGYSFTRQQLYELVWTVPISTLAKSLKVSDVGLAKACRRGDIPLPPRGYWAKLHAGRRVTRPPLPPRGPGASHRVNIGVGAPHAYRANSVDDCAKLEDTPPEPPIYDETLDEVEVRIRQALPSKFRYIRALDNPHPLIARLLREDDARREARMKSGYSWDKPCFESSFEQRRLTFLSNLFTLLATLDVYATVRGREARELLVQVGCQHVELKVDALEALRPRKGRIAGRRGEPMAIEVRVGRWKHDEAEERLFWSDGDTGRIENQLRDIAVALVLTGERQYRKARQFAHEWDKHDFEERLERARQAREAAEARECEERAQAERDRVGRLLAQVNAYQQAQQIREYVGKVVAFPLAIQGRAFDGDREAWARWALAVAEQLDPLAPSANGRANE